MSSKAYFSTYIDVSKKLLSLPSNSELKKEIFQIQKIDFEGEKWSKENYFAGYTSYGSMDKLHLSSPNFAFLEKAISRKIAKFVRILEWDIHPRDLAMNSCWVNIMPRGAHHSFHIHPHSVISGTYYVDVPQGASPLKFEDPRLSQMMLAPSRKTNCKDGNKNFVSISSTSRDLLLFESWLRHEVPSNQTKKPRLSVSFNYSFR